MGTSRDTPRPWRIYVSGRSMETGSTPTRAPTLTESSATTRCGRHGGVTLRSCHLGAMTRQAGELGEGSSERSRMILGGVQDRLWNLERFIVFQTVILQRSRHVIASHAIQRRIEKRLNA